jgi:hypothetical protein
MFDLHVDALKRQGALAKNEFVPGLFLQIIIDMLKFLCDNLETTKASYEIILCEEMLIRAMRTLFSDHHVHDVRKFVRVLREGLLSLLDERLSQYLFGLSIIQDLDIYYSQFLNSRHRTAMNTLMVGGLPIYF